MIRKPVSCVLIILMAATILLTGCGAKKKKQQQASTEGSTSRTVKTESSTPAQSAVSTESSNQGATAATTGLSKPGSITIPKPSIPTVTTITEEPSKPASTDTMTEPSRPASTVATTEPSKPTSTAVTAETSKPTPTAVPTESSKPVASEGKKDSGQSGSWVKYASLDGYSFHYPEGWAVKEEATAIAIENENTDEELFMVAIPFDINKDSAALANDFISLLKIGNPNIKAFNWNVESNAGVSQAFFDLSDDFAGKKYSGSGIVIKDSQQAIWISYTSCDQTYSRDRGNALIQGFLMSFASGSGSKNPNIIYDHELIEKMDRNAKGFLFVLEFALGAPFTCSQEQTILDELKNGWRRLNEQKLDEYDQYPVLVQATLTMNQNELAELRKELEKTITEWLENMSDSSGAMEIIRNQLNIRGKVIVEGEPPLTEMSLTAYSEVIAYSRLLRQNPDALPDQISLDSVGEIKKQVQDSWNNFTAKEQEQIVNSPGIWFCLRSLMSNGSESEQDNIRSELLKLTQAAQTSENSNTGSGEEGQPMSMAEHNTILWMQQFTANHYLYTHGYYSQFFGRMW